MNSIADSRPNYIDYAKVFAIFCVVLGHYTYVLDFSYEPSPIWSVMHIITLFHMPFFFIVSGLLYKKIDIMGVISKGWIQLLKPYLIMSVIVSVIMIMLETIMDGVSIKYIVSVAIGIFSANDFPFGLANWSSALWFCYSLFLIKLLYTYLSGLRWGGQFIILTCLIGVIMMFLGNKLPMRLDSSLVGFAFFTIGVKCSKLLIKIKDLSMSKRLLILLLALIILFTSAYFNLNLHQRQGLSINAMYFGPYPVLFLVSGVSGTIVMLLLSTFLSSFKNNIILTLSNGTIVILGFHWTIYKLGFGWWLTSHNVFTAICVVIINMIVCYSLILLFNRYCPAILGNRKLK